MKELLCTLTTVLGWSCSNAAETPPPPPPPPAHYTVSVSVTGLDGSLVLQNNQQDDMSVSVNGTSSFVTKVTAGSAYTVSVKSSPKWQSCTVQNASGTATSDVTLGVSCGPGVLNFNNGQAAGVVLGQPDFTTSTAPTAPWDASKIGFVYSNMAVASNGALYIPSVQGNRVMRFDSIPTTNNAAADLVIGQPDFSTITLNTTRNGMFAPSTVAVDGSRLVVADEGNHRVLIYHSLATANQPNADVVLGQATFNDMSTSCAPKKFQNVEGVFVVGSKVIASDTDYHRVFIYNSIPTQNDTAPDLVLGQNSFTTCAPNDDDQDGNEDAGPTARTLNQPVGIWSDGTRLIVSDYINGRVLIWNTFPTANFQPADVVIGQPDMTTATPAATASGLAGPYGLISNGRQLFVADADNNRVLVYNSIPTQNGASASAVLGQPDLSTGTTASPTASNLNNPEGLALYHDKLIVADTNRYRVLIYTAN